MAQRESGPAPEVAGPGDSPQHGTTPAPRRRGRLWSYADIAAHAGITAGTVRYYRHRGLLPAPDVMLDPRSPRWYPETITTWHARRPGPGARTDLTG